MKFIDASGPIYEGMWSYGQPFPDFKIRELEHPDWLEFEAYSQAFDGFSMVTGTYIDGPAHCLGLKKAGPIHEVPLEKLFGVDAYVLKFELENLSKEGNRPYISLEDVKRAEKEIIPEEANIIFATGWGKHWEKPDFLTHCWFLKKDALEYILSKKPFILAMDTPSIDNVNNEQGLWPMIFKNNIYIVAPLTNVENISKFKVKLFVCPLKILNTTGLPCRVIIGE